MNKKILVKGYYNYNFGDDLFVKILLDRFPDDHFNIIAPSQYKAVWNNAKNVSCV
jgi:colanic acid/amylovoran biosynthesis protein